MLWARRHVHVRSARQAVNHGRREAETCVSRSIPDLAGIFKTQARPCCRLSISTRFAFVFLVAIGMMAAAFYMILDRIYLNQLKSQAETVADNVDAFGTWVAQYGRVWVKDDDASYLGHLPAYQMEEGVAVTASGLKPVHFIQESGAGPARVLGGRRALGVAVQFRLTSHNVMNPGNAPDPFEVAALQRIRDDGLRSTSSSRLTDFATRAPSTTRPRASAATARPPARRATSSSATAPPTASASRRATSPASSASACRRGRSGRWRSSSWAAGSSR